MYSYFLILNITILIQFRIVIEISKAAIARSNKTME